MSLREKFGNYSQDKNVIPIIPNIPTITPNPNSGDIGGILGRNMQTLGIRIDATLGNSGDSGDIGVIDINPKNTPPMKAGEGGYLVPDYAAWCPRWWKGCLECPDFMRDRIRFCRKWNLTFCGVEVVAA